MGVGAWLNLRQLRYAGDRETGLALAAVAGAVWLLLGLILLVVGLVAGLPGALVLLFIVIGVLGPPVPARYLYLHVLAGRHWLGGTGGRS
jgi:hypothetical protein